MQQKELVFKRLSSDLEVILQEHLDTLKGGFSDGILLEEVEIFGDAPLPDVPFPDPDFDYDDDTQFEWEMDDDSAFEWEYDYNNGEPPVEDPKALELLWAAIHPVAAAVFKSNANAASKKAAELFPIESLHNGKGDAFRHALWSALNASFAYNQAREFGNLHESASGGPANEIQMDLRNNNYGYALAKDHPDWGVQDFIDHIYWAAENNKLTVL